MTLIDCSSSMSIVMALPPHAAPVTADLVGCPIPAGARTHLYACQHQIVGAPWHPPPPPLIFIAIGPIRRYRWRFCDHGSNVPCGARVLQFAIANAYWLCEPPRILTTLTSMPAMDAGGADDGGNFLESLESDYECPILGGVMKDPVTILKTGCGHTMSREAVDRLFQGHGHDRMNVARCPMCRKDFKPEDVAPAYTLQYVRHCACI